MPIKFITYGNYIYVPILATVVWLGNLLGLLLWWLVADDSRLYERDEPNVVFISDVGAAHKPFFIAMNALTWVFYVLSLLCERWLRHVDRIPGTVRSRERTFDILAIVFAFVAGGALTFLAIFDAFNHSNAHWSLTLVFVVCVALSAIFQTLEVHALSKDHPDRRHLKRNMWIKLFIVALAIAGAICFGGSYAWCGGNRTGSRSHCNRVSSVAAVFEWSIALLFDIYLATFVLDLWPAAKTSPRALRRIERQRREKGLLDESSLENGTSHPSSFDGIQEPMRQRGY